MIEISEDFVEGKPQHKCKWLKRKALMTVSHDFSAV